MTDSREDLYTVDDPLFQDVSVHIQENLEDEVVQEALRAGVDLRLYSQQVEKDLKDVEDVSIQDYIKESQNIASLHNQISSCDEILEKMEQMLLTFQTDLSSISSEILTLQQESIAMNVKLKNRQAVRRDLGQFIDDMIVPETLIQHIMDTPVTDSNFLDNLYTLDHKINFVKEQSFKEARACTDIMDVLDKLKIKSLTKIREFFLIKINQFKKPMTNYQIPQNAMLKFKFFFQFLMANEPEIAREVRDEYLDTTSKIFCSYFKAYTSRLMKLQYEEVADKDDLIGVDDSVKKGLFTSKPSLKNRATIFSLGNRGSALTTDLEAPIIVPHAAQKNETKHSFESLFRSQQFALVDNASREYMFLSEFFMVAGPAAQELFNAVWGKTLSSLLKHIDTYTQECYDSIALFLCLHLTYRYNVLMNKRTVPALDKYWETVQEMLWPRFEYILQLNIQSIRDCDPQKLGHIDMRPHYITRRYAEFAAAIVGINESFPSERVSRLMGTLHSEVENFLLRLAAEFSDRKEQLILLINNYDMVLSVIMERTKEDCKETESLKQLLNARCQEFVEVVLSPHFGGLVTFVKDGEVMLERGQMDLLKREEKRVPVLIKSFAADWKRALDEINQEIMRSFTNFKVGTNILQMTLTQMIQYYHRFQKILSQPMFKSLPARSELINIHHIMVEVKKYKPAF